MKVYVVYTVPDYIGIDIVHIFYTEDDAKRFIQDHENEYHPTEHLDYYEEEVLHYVGLVNK